MPEPTPAITPFRFQDGERLIVFGTGCIEQAEELLGDGYALLTTPRALAGLPALGERASAVHEVRPGRVDEIAGELRGEVQGELLVALGGGRVVDVAKALAAADPPRRVAAIPTTLSAAEMTAIHRHAAGVDAATPRVRPALVINDPRICASQPLPELAASTANALAHAAEATCTTLRNPVCTMAALETARLCAKGWNKDEPAREPLALAALLSGWANGATLYGLHHVLSQTLARFAGVGHGPANAIMLPHSLGALERRFPAEIAAVGEALGEEAPSFAARLARLSGSAHLREQGVTPEALVECAEQAAGRAELDLTPPRADRGEITVLYEAAL